MIRFSLAVATFLASTSAFAGDVYDFKIGGQSVHIEQPRNCNSPSCVSVSIPGIYEFGPKRKRIGNDDDADVSRDRKDAAVTPAPAATAPALPASPGPGLAAAPPALEKSLEPANGAPAALDNRAGREATLPPPPAGGGLAAPVIANAPAAAPAVPQAKAVDPTSPLGLWLTEEKEGKVRIEACGANLCGYSVDAKTDRNGEQVLINMKPASGKWTGRIHDPKSGSNYDSTIALKGADHLRVQGCAFGGMFCGGQTWSRVN